MKVYIYTEANLFMPEVYVGVAKSRKDAEKAMRKIYPHMKQNGANSYVSGAIEPIKLLFIHEEDI